MSENTKKLKIRRIAVTLSSEGPDDLTLAAAAQLAASLQSEISGLFVEDLNLLRLAGLPFTREFSHFSSIERQLESADVERQMKTKAIAAQRTLAVVAERAGVPWSFRVTRGLVASKVLEAAAQADVIALGAAQQELVQHKALWTLAEGRDSRSQRSTRRAAETGPAKPIVAVFKESVAAQRALQVAINQAMVARRPLRVFIVADSQQNAVRLREQATELLGNQAAHFRRFIHPEFGEVLAAVRAEGAWLLVLEADESVLERGAIQMLCDQLSCPALLVR